MTRVFPLRTVLTVTTGRLLTKRRGKDDNGIGDLYEILRFMTGDNSVSSHQLGRFASECEPHLFRQCPDLAKAGTDESLAGLDAMIKDRGSAGIEDWLDSLVHVAGLPAELDVAPIPIDDHTTIDPYDELVVKRGTDEGILLLQRETTP